MPKFTDNELTHLRIGGNTEADRQEWLLLTLARTQPDQSVVASETRPVDVEDNSGSIAVTPVDVTNYMTFAKESLTPPQRLVKQDPAKFTHAYFAGSKRNDIISEEDVEAENKLRSPANNTTFFKIETLAHTMQIRNENGKILIQTPTINPETHVREVDYSKKEPRYGYDKKNIEDPEAINSLMLLLFWLKNPLEATLTERTPDGRQILSAKTVNQNDRALTELSALLNVSSDNELEIACPLRSNRKLLRESSSLSEGFPDTTSNDDEINNEASSLDKAIAKAQGLLDELYPNQQKRPKVLLFKKEEGVFEFLTVVGSIKQELVEHTARTFSLIETAKLRNKIGFTTERLMRGSDTLLFSLPFSLSVSLLICRRANTLAWLPIMAPSFLMLASMRHAWMSGIESSGLKELYGLAENLQHKPDPEASSLDKIAHYFSAAMAIPVQKIPGLQLILTTPLYAYAIKYMLERAGLKGRTVELDIIMMMAYTKGIFQVISPQMQSAQTNPQQRAHSSASVLLTLFYGLGTLEAIKQLLPAATWFLYTKAIIKFFNLFEPTAKQPIIALLAVLASQSQTPFNRFFDIPRLQRAISALENQMDSLLTSSQASSSQIALVKISKFLNTLYANSLGNPFLQYLISGDYVTRQKVRWLGRWGTYQSDLFCKVLTDALMGAFIGHLLNESFAHFNRDSTELNITLMLLMGVALGAAGFISASQAQGLAVKANLATLGQSDRHNYYTFANERLWVILRDWIQKRQDYPFSHNPMPSRETLANLPQSPSSPPAWQKSIKATEIPGIMAFWACVTGVEILALSYLPGSHEFFDNLAEETRIPQGVIGSMAAGVLGLGSYGLWQASRTLTEAPENDHRGQYLYVGHAV